MLGVALLCAAPLADASPQLAATVRSGRITATVTGGELASLTVAMPSGAERKYALLPGSGTTLEGCAVSGVRVAEAEQAATITRTWTCAPNAQYHNVSGARAVVTDSFSATASGSVRWVANVSSAGAAAWSVPITAALGFADWSDADRVWLGGPRNGDAVAIGNDPFAPFPLPKAGDGRGGGLASAADGFFIAQDYDATYNCLTSPCVPANPPTTATWQACEAACGKAKSCTIFAWSKRSQHCWFRTDGKWGAAGTLQKYAAVSGCKSGTDPVTGNPYVKGCGAVPLGPSTSKFMYGGSDNNIGDPQMAEDTASVLPLLNRVDTTHGKRHDHFWISAPLPQEPQDIIVRKGVGLSLIQSPEDTPIVAWATVGAEGAGAWLNWTRAYHRLGGNSLPVSFSADFVAHAPDWRPAAAWMVERYP